MEHIVLEYDESTRTALVVATSNKREPVLSGHASPYIVADGYDFESRCQDRLRALVPPFLSSSGGQAAR